MARAYCVPSTRHQRTHVDALHIPHARVPSDSYSILPVIKVYMLLYQPSNMHTWYIRSMYITGINTMVYILRSFNDIIQFDSY